MKTDGTPETEFEEAMPLLGAIMGQMSADRAWTENQLQGMTEQRVRDLQRDYVKLYAAMEKVFEKTDSATARDALDRFYHVYQSAADSLTQSEGSYR